MASPAPRVLALATLLLCASASDDPDMDTLYARSLLVFGWPPASAVNATAAAALSYLPLLNSSCYFNDVDYFDRSRDTWLTETHLLRVTTMTQALTAPTSPVFEDPTLTTATHCALGVWLARDFTSDNWWFQWIGTELNLQSIYLMLGSNRTSASEQALLVQYSYNSAWWVNDWGGGANLVWMVQVEILRGLASGNVTAVTQAFNAMWGDVRNGSAVEGFEGIMYDNSYHFHGEQILSSAYGLVWLQDVLQFRAIAAGTRFDLNPSQLGLVAAFIANGDAQLTFGNGWDFGTQGRGIDRPASTYFTWGLPTDAIRNLSGTTGGAPYSAQLLAFADKLDGVQSSPPLVSNVYFWTSDFHVHHRPGWGAALKMHGDNTFWTVLQNECDNGENLLGEHTGDGALNVYASSELSVANDTYGGIFPLLDWNGINGITVEHDILIETCQSDNLWPVIDTAFVGGVSDGLYGAGAMDTATHNLTAARSWFFFDDAILALGTRLVDPAPANVRTSLASRIVPQAAADPVRGTCTVAWANGSVVVVPDSTLSVPDAASVAWMNVGGLGIIPAVAAVEGDSGTNGFGFTIGIANGSWSTIGPNPGRVWARTLHAWLDHGSVITNGAYAYMLLPNTSAAQMANASATNGGLACMTNSVALQAASQPSARVASAVVWDASGAAYNCSATSNGSPWALDMSVDMDALVTFREDAGVVNVTVAHPYKLSRTVHVTLNRVVTGANCTSAGSGATTFAVTLPSDPSFAGQSTTVSCAV